MFKIVLTLSLFFTMIFTGNLNAQSNKWTKVIPSEWEVGHMDSKDSEPNSYFKAQVPGATILDYMKAEKKPSFHMGNNVKEYVAFEDKYWKYRTSFDPPEIPAGHHMYFKSKGIDYEFEILLNGTVIHSQEGMFTPVELVLDDYLNENNILEVLIYPVPKDPTQPIGKRQAKNVAKPPVPYGWDWHPRLIPVGMWDDTWLEVSPETRIQFADLNYDLNKDYSNVDLNYTVRVDHHEEMSYQWTILNKGGDPVFEKAGAVNTGEIVLDGQIKDVNLWWPHDHGDPYLYESILKIANNQGTTIDAVNRKIGFREAKLVMNEGAWDAPEGFPKSRSVPPFTLQINGRRIFAKGSNWVHPEIFYGIVDSDRYLEQIELAKKANFNLLRIWGGGITNKAAFFEHCDQLGIMVWQEFPLGCNPYPDDPHYLKILEQEARSIIYRVRQHPSLAMWSGGNELFNRWSMMDDQSLALRLLNSLCYQIDPGTPFIPTSPVMGVGHGHYIFYEAATGEEVFQVMQRANNTAYTEFGMPGLASVETLKKIIPKEELFPPKPGTSWETHHAFGAWQQNSWLEQPTLERYFGKAKNLEELVQQSQLLQCVGYKCIYENARRKKPYCSMAVNWCYNEPWPTAANNSLISYPTELKPAFHAVAASCRPILASAFFDKFAWEGGEVLDIDCMILNDAPKDMKGGKVKVSVLIDGKQEELLTWTYTGLEANVNYEGPVVRYLLPDDFKEQIFKVKLEVADHPEWDSTYQLLYRSSEKDDVIIYELNQ